MYEEYLEGMYEILKKWDRWMIDALYDELAEGRALIKCMREIHNEIKKTKDELEQILFVDIVQKAFDKSKGEKNKNEMCRESKLQKIIPKGIEFFKAGECGAPMREGVGFVIVGETVDGRKATIVVDWDKPIEIKSTNPMVVTKERKL